MKKATLELSVSLFALRKPSLIAEFLYSASVIQRLFLSKNANAINLHLIDYQVKLRIKPEMTRQKLQISKFLHVNYINHSVNHERKYLFHLQ